MKTVGYVDTARKFTVYQLLHYWVATVSEEWSGYCFGADHATVYYYKGFHMLTLGWSNGHTFIPVDFSLLASLKSQVNGIMEGNDKRTSGYKRCVEALLPDPD
ncbi:hypothetical protein BK133_20880 [Paenibacillus sp. FSL H8-0548]|nr:hypothetical protein BK133_20880 [Paenibacillus sp. FSL H8-0548]